MIKKSFTYKSLFDDREITQDFYFHLSKAELINLEMNTPEGLEAMLTRIANSKDKAEIYNTFTKVILLSYGRRTPEGDFIKTPEWTSAFEHSPAMDQLLLSFFEDGNVAGEFIKGIMPIDQKVDQDKPSYPPPSPLSVTKDAS